MPYTITNEGMYCLAESVVGTITIDADKVALDLSGRSIGQADIAINVLGHSDITIRNGMIESVTDKGIAIDNSANIMLQDLIFSRNDVGTFITTSSCIIIDHCIFTEHTAPALLLQNTTIGHITDVVFQQNYGSAVMQLCKSNNVTCKNIEIVENTNTDTAVNTGGIIAESMGNSSFIDCKVNNNTTASLSVYGAFLFDSCCNMYVHNCTANSNESTVMCAGFMVMGNTKNVIIDSCIANYNNSEQLTNGLTIGFFLFGGEHHAIIHCTARDNQARGQCVGIGTSLAIDCRIQNNEVIDNKGDQSSIGIVSTLINMVWSNSAKGHQPNLYGIMPKVTYDMVNGCFKIYDTNTPTTPTSYDNISIE
jgi:hypothetical protein